MRLFRSSLNYFLCPFLPSPPNFSTGEKVKGSRSQRWKHLIIPLLSASLPFTPRIHWCDIECFLCHVFHPCSPWNLVWPIRCSFYEETLIKCFICWTPQVVSSCRQPEQRLVHAAQRVCEGKQTFSQQVSIKRVIRCHIDEPSHKYLTKNIYTASQMVPLEQQSLLWKVLHMKHIWLWLNLLAT